MITFFPSLIREAYESHFGDRIVWICAAGSIVHARSGVTSDLDLMLVLDSSSPDDLELCLSAHRDLRHNYPNISMSLVYRDEIPDDPELVRDGANGCMALAYINAAFTIAGENVFAEHFANLSNEAFRSSIVETVQRYAHDLTESFLSGVYPESAMRSRAMKYLARSLSDLILFETPDDTEKFDPLTPEQVLREYGARLELLVPGLNSLSSTSEMIHGVRRISAHLAQRHPRNR